MRQGIHTTSDSDITLPPCYYCKHVLKNGGMDPKGYTCKAYPDGVPVTITLRYDRHDTIDPFFGDQFAYEPETYRDGNGDEYWYDYEGNPVYPVS